MMFSLSSDTNKKNRSIRVDAPFFVVVFVFCYPFRTGSLVSPTPSFLKILRSTSLTITVV